MSAAKLFIKLIIVIAIVAGTFGIVQYLKANKPGIGRKAKEKISYLVDVKNIELAEEPVIIEAMGTVVPVRQTTIKSRVAGEIITVSDSFKPGGFFTKGQKMIKIDPTDYKLALEQAKAQLDSAQATRELEMGQQAVARREWDLVNKDKSLSEMEMSLALRKPQLKQAQANVSIANTSISDINLDLQRTDIVAPYNCIVLEKSVDLGTNISTQDTIASVVDVDKFWVEVSVPQDQLHWIEVPHMDQGYGSDVIVRYNGDTVNGRVVSLLSDLEDKGRMARVLVEIVDPLNIQGKDDRLPLLLSNYVKAEIHGKDLDNVVKIPRTSFRDGNQVWLAKTDAEGKVRLEMRDVKIIWRDENFVVVSDGLQTGDVLVTSAIASPMEGMDLRIHDKDQQQVSEKQ